MAKRKRKRGRSWEDPMERLHQSAVAKNIKEEDEEIDRGLTGRFRASRNGEEWESMNDFLSAEVKIDTSEFQQQMTKAINSMNKSIFGQFTATGVGQGSYSIMRQTLLYGKPEPRAEMTFKIDEELLPAMAKWQQNPREVKVTIEGFPSEGDTIVFNLVRDINLDVSASPGDMTQYQLSMTAYEMEHNEPLPEPEPKTVNVPKRRIAKKPGKEQQ